MDRITRIERAIDASALIARKATRMRAEEIAAIPDLTVEKIADHLYLSGSKGGKAAAMAVAPAILRAAQED